jgi:hypothetical protein
MYRRCTPSSFFIEQQHQVKVGLEIIREGMMEEFNLKFLKIRKLSLHANSNRKRILMQLFSRKFIELYKRTTRFWMLDESWLNM